MTDEQRQKITREAAEIVQELNLDAETEDTEVSFDIDDLVHDAASEISSNVNNNGLDGQVEFLVEQWGKDVAMKAIREAME